MMRLILLIGVLTAAALGLSLLSDIDGSISLTMLGYRFETTLTIGVAFVLAATVVLASLWSLIRFIFRIPELISLGLSSRRKHKGHLALSRGMIALGAGDATLARKNAEEAHRLLGKEPLTLLLSAQSAQFDGNRVKAERAFEDMLSDPETRLLGLRGLFIEAQRAGDLVHSIRYADDALTFSSKATWATEALIDYFVAENEFDKALLAFDRGRAGFEKAKAKRIRAVILTARALANESHDPEGALNNVQEAVKLSNNLVMAHIVLGRLYARRGDFRKASRDLESAWRQSPHPEIAEAYLSVRSGDAARERLQRARKLQSLHAEHFESRMIMARAAMDAREFDLAREIVKPLIDNNPTMRVCLLMAELEELDQSQKGLTREWLQRATHAPRDEAWIGDGLVLDHWSPLSPLSKKLDHVHWAKIPEAVSSDRLTTILNTALRGIEHASSRNETRGTLSARSFLDVKEGLEPIEETTPKAKRPSRGPVIFPLSHSPDDPGLHADSVSDEKSKP